MQIRKNRSGHKKRDSAGKRGEPGRLGGPASFPAPSANQPRPIRKFRLPAASMNFSARGA